MLEEPANPAASGGGSHSLPAVQFLEPWHHTSVSSLDFLEVTGLTLALWLLSQLTLAKASPPISQH